jgi:pimeloyl-ACP methyl ester carboxylesterase
MPYATSPDGTRLFYECFAPTGTSKPLPVVLIAGWATNGRLWRPAVEGGTTAGYEVVTTDSRGTGRSGLPRRPWSTATLATDVVAVMDHAGIERAHVAAPSLGGMVAQELALRHPNRVAALVLAATTGGLPRIGHFRPAGLARLMFGWARTAGKPGDRADAVRHALRLAVSEDFARAAMPADPAWQAVEQMLIDPATTRGNLYGLLAAAAHSTWSRLPRLRAAVQVQHGSADRLISIRAARALVAAIPHAQFEVLDGAGHALILERPDDTMSLGLSFLDRHPGGSIRGVEAERAGPRIASGGSEAVAARPAASTRGGQT